MNALATQRLRWVLAAALALGVTAGATACGVTKTSTRCENADCSVELSGVDADAELDSLGLTVVLTSTEGDMATLEVLGEDGGPDETIELAEGESAEALGNEVTLERVEGSDVTVRLRPEG